MSVEPFKYLLQPVALERNGSGRVVQEIPASVLTVYSAEQAADAIRAFEEQIVNHEEGAAVNKTTTPEPEPTPEPTPEPEPDDGEPDEE